MHEKLTISCSNLRGLNKNPKLNLKMQHLNKHLESIIKVVIDDHADNNTIKQLRMKYKIELSQYEINGNFSKHRGILVLTKKSSGYTTTNFKLIDATDTLQFDAIGPDGTIYNIVAIYAPSGNNSDYFKTVHNKTTISDNKYQILIGDLNLTLNPELDRVNYKHEYDSHTQGRAVINNWITNDEYVDTFRYLHPNTRGYTYRKDSDKSQMSRLDYCLVSPSLIDKISSCEHKFTTASDHASIIIEIDTNIERNGKGTFRAPPFIQNDPEYVKLAIDSIIDTQLGSKQDTP